MHIWLILFICLFSVSGFSQNYITDYHQPSILGYEKILEGDYYKAIEYLEQCVSQEKVFAPELYSLGICYFLTEQYQEGKNRIFESYTKGHTLRAVTQDSILLVKHFSEKEYGLFKDSCIKLNSLHDSLEKVKYSDENKVVNTLFKFRWANKAYMDSIKREMDSIEYMNNKPKYVEEHQNQLKKRIDKSIEKIGWQTAGRLLAGQSFLWVIYPLSDEDLEQIISTVFIELKKGNLSPMFYAKLYDLLEVRITGQEKYFSRSIRAVGIDPILMSDTEKEILKNNRFQIGLGGKEIRNLMYRE